MEANWLFLVSIDPGYIGGDPDKAQEIVKKSGQMGVPVLDIEGKIIVGFDKEAIEKALNLPGSSLIWQKTRFAEWMLMKKPALDWPAEKRSISSVANTALENFPKNRRFRKR